MPCVPPIPCSTPDTRYRASAPNAVSVGCASVAAVTSNHVVPGDGGISNVPPGMSTNAVLDVENAGGATSNVVIVPGGTSIGTSPLRASAGSSSPSAAPKPHRQPSCAASKAPTYSDLTPLEYAEKKERRLRRKPPLARGAC